MHRYHTNSEDGMLESFQNGEEAGFAYIFKKYYSVLTYYALRFVNDKDMANDIVQDAFMNLWGKRENFPAINSIKSYLYRSVYNICVSGFHKNKREQQKLNELVVSEVIEETHYDHIVRAELLGEVYRILASLPAGFAEVIRLYYIEGKGIREIAAILDIPVYTVKSRRARAIHRLRQMLPGYFTLHSLLIILSSLQ